MRPPAITSAMLVGLSAWISCGDIRITTQPSAMYRVPLRPWNPSIRNIFIAMPAAAPVHTTASVTIDHGLCSTISASGVVVPAMSTKIMEWSSRLSTRRDRTDRAMRW